MDNTTTCNGNVEVDEVKLETKPNGVAICTSTADAGANDSSSISNSQSDINSLSKKECSSVDSDCESESGACNNSDNVRVVNADVHKENEVTHNGGIDSSNTSDSSNDESSTIVYNVHIDEKTEDVCLDCRHRIASNKNSYKKQKKRSVNTLVHRHTL